ncbi:MAG: peptide chain release factor N(5)-glutamine methyltransferase [Idiomarina sp.]|nr:peptide chain release factor N(5)-glutamine methyltransferase [Idiomarina sp.]
MSLLSIAATLQRAIAELRSAGSESPELDAQVLLRHVLQCDRSYFFTWPERDVPAAEAAQFRALLAQRVQGLPIAHLIGTREFWSLSLLVNNSTLIPRPDTEILVERALQLNLPAQARVLELGTGTGAIALALASERPDWQITAVDCVAEAVALARKNQQQLNIPNVAILQSDWFSEVSAQQFDLVISNPPYIDPQDPHLQQGDVRFEPRSALVADNRGLADIEHIIAHAKPYLTANGWVLLEHGSEQAAAAQRIFEKHRYNEIHTVQDYANLNRVTGAKA